MGLAAGQIFNGPAWQAQANLQRLHEAGDQEGVATLLVAEAGAETAFRPGKFEFHAPLKFWDSEVCT